MPHVGDPSFSIRDTGLNSMREFSLVVTCEVCNVTFGTSRFVTDEEIADSESKPDPAKVSRIMGEMSRKLQIRHRFEKPATTESVS